jgi:hypothetical protein
VDLKYQISHFENQENDVPYETGRRINTYDTISGSPGELVNDGTRKEIGKETQLKFDKVLAQAVLQYESDY